MKAKTSMVVEYVNEHAGDNDSTVAKLLTWYVNTSCRRWDKSESGEWVGSQPAWPGKTVSDYRFEYDPSMECAGRAMRIKLSFEEGGGCDVSASRFKKFARKRVI